MEKTKKILWILILIVFILNLVLLFAGMIISFCDVKEEYQSGYYDYSTTSTKWIDGYYTYTPNPSAGIIPLFSLLLCILGFVLFFCSKKRPLLSIGVISSIILSRFLMSFNIFVTKGTEGSLGYSFLTITFNNFSFVLIALTVFLVFDSFKKNLTQNNNSIVDSQQITTQDFDNQYEKLKELHQIYSDGVLTEQEFLKEKEKILK